MMKRNAEIFSRIRCRMHDRKGDSIAEALIALTIAALSLVMLATMIASGSKFVQQSENYMRDFYQAENSMFNTSVGSGTYTLRQSGTSVTGLATTSGNVNYYSYSAGGETIFAYSVSGG